MLHSTAPEHQKNALKGSRKLWKKHISREQLYEPLDHKEAEQSTIQVVCWT